MGNDQCCYQQCQPCCKTGERVVHYMPPQPSAWHDESVRSYRSSTEVWGDSSQWEHDTEQAIPHQNQSLSWQDDPLSEDEECPRNKLFKRSASMPLKRMESRSQYTSHANLEDEWMNLKTDGFSTTSSSKFKRSDSGGQYAFDGHGTTKTSHPKDRGVANKFRRSNSEHWPASHSLEATPKCHNSREGGTKSNKTKQSGRFWRSVSRQFDGSPGSVEREQSVEDGTGPSKFRRSASGISTTSPGISTISAHSRDSREDKLKRLGSGFKFGDDEGASPTSRRPSVIDKEGDDDRQDRSPSNKLRRSASGIPHHSRPDVPKLKRSASGIPPASSNDHAKVKSNSHTREHTQSRRSSSPDSLPIASSQSRRKRSSSPTFTAPSSHGSRASSPGAAPSLKLPFSSCQVDINCA